MIRREDVSRPGEIQGVKIGSLFIVNNLEDGRVYIFDDDVNVNFSFPLSAATVHAGGTMDEALKALAAGKSPPAVSAALNAALHELITLHNLTVTDVPEERDDAIRNGKDAAGLQWVTDTSRAVNLIDEAITSLE